MTARLGPVVIEVLGRDGAQLHREVVLGLAFAQQLANEHNGTAVMLVNEPGFWQLYGNYVPAKRTKAPPVEVIEEVATE